jgi:hypothetical protein
MLRASPASDDQEEGPQQTRERQRTSEHGPRLQTLSCDQILERGGEAKPSATACQLHSRVPVHPSQVLPTFLVEHRAQGLRPLGSAVIEQALVRRGCLILDPPSRNSCGVNHCK